LQPTVSTREVSCDGTQQRHGSPYLAEQYQHPNNPRFRNHLIGEAINIGLCSMNREDVFSLSRSWKPLPNFLNEGKYFFPRTNQSPENRTVSALSIHGAMKGAVAFPISSYKIYLVKKARWP
jgi:hypothetical protein